MTFSIAARCPTSGAFGVAISSSSIAVASRCAFVRAGVGAALSQNVTDPRLGPQALELMAAGCSAEEALDRIVANAEHVAWRQLAAVDRSGAVAHRSGARALGTHAAATGAGCVAIGNLLASSAVPSVMVEAFSATSGHLAARLLRGLKAGLEAGGEEGPVRSAGLLIAERVPWPVVDLRVDWAERPIAALGELWALYAPQLETYVARALDPAASPAFGVPGDR